MGVQLQLSCRTILLIQLLQQLVVAIDDCDKEIVGAGNLLIQKQLSVHFETVEPVAAPWDKHIFIVGANHKAGTFLLRKIMRHWFDLLGATSSCTMERSWPRSITTLNHIHNCDLYPAPIRYTWNISGDMILQMRKETNDMKGDLRGVIIVRDPLEMVALAYVYHHRGEEPWNEPMEQGIPLMAPEEGVPEMAERMEYVITAMASAYEVRAPDILAVRYEDITNSSEHFDAAIEKIMDFLFDDITDLQKAEMMKAARVEDLHRAGDDDEHTNDEDEMNEARASLHLMSADLYATYVKAREVLGYV